MGGSGTGRAVGCEGVVGTLGAWECAVGVAYWEPAVRRLNGRGAISENLRWPKVWSLVIAIYVNSRTGRYRLGPFLLKGTKVNEKSKRRIPPSSSHSTSSYDISTNIHPAVYLSHSSIPPIPSLSFPPSSPHTPHPRPTHVDIRPCARPQLSSLFRILAPHSPPTSCSSPAHSHHLCSPVRSDSPQLLNLSRSGQCHIPLPTRSRRRE